MIGLEPSSSKNPGDTKNAGTCSGMSTPDRLASHHWYIAQSLTVLDCSRHSRKSAAVTLIRSKKLSSGSHRGGDDETIDTGEAVGTQDQRVHQAERRAVGGERERQRDDDRERQQRALDDRASRIEHIARQSRPPRALGLHRGDRDPADRRLAAQHPHDAVAHGDARGSAAGAIALPARRPRVSHTCACSSRRSPMIDSRSSLSRTTIESACSANFMI